MHGPWLEKSEANTMSESNRKLRRWLLVSVLASVKPWSMLLFPHAGRICIGACMSPCHLIVLPQPSEQFGGSFGQMCRLTLAEQENPFFPPLCSPQEALCPVFYRTCESKTFETKILFLKKWGLLQVFMEFLVRKFYVEHCLDLWLWVVVVFALPALHFHFYTVSSSEVDELV